MNDLPKLKTIIGSTSAEQNRKIKFANYLRSSPIPNCELPDNLGLYLTRQTLSRINFIQDIYKKIVPVHGVVMEFGVRWGQNMALFSSLRGIHEPFNYNRKIIGFDTFEGFPSVDLNDGLMLKKGDYSVLPDYRESLDQILHDHEMLSPISQISKHELIEGDASLTLPEYLRDHPETIVALAYFDFDIYKPTRDCLKALQPFLTKGSILAFDELNAAPFPGETIALKEVLGLSRYALRRDPNSPLTSYLVVE